MPAYDFHVFVCQNQRPEGHPLGCCLSKGSDKLLEYMKMRVKELGVENIRINKSGCLDQCSTGPALVIYPIGKWFYPQSIQDVEEIIQLHIIKTRSVDKIF